MSTSSLFAPTQVGNMHLAHRVVLAPLTRQRANDDHVHSDLAAVYYGQRGSVPGTMLITEATYVAQKAGGYPNVPGNWSQEQVQAWKKVTEAVHARGSFIYLQIWGLGRGAEPEALAAEDPSFPYVSSSATKREGTTHVPRPLTPEELTEYVELFATAARNAVQDAGFDGVELNAGNGYLLDQFIQDKVNVRTDQYGGSVENRARFPLEVVDAVVEAIGAERTGLRLAPWSKWNGMGMDDPIPTFSHLIREVRARHPDFAYLHLIQPRIVGGYDESDPAAPAADPSLAHASNDFARALWSPKPIILGGGFTPATAQAQADAHGDLISFGRYFISNPDLPTRIAKGIPLTPYDRSTFYYTKETAKGYTDYPFATEAEVEGVKAN